VSCVHECVGKTKLSIPIGKNRLILDHDIKLDLKVRLSIALIHLVQDA